MDEPTMRDLIRDALTADPDVSDDTHAFELLKALKVNAKATSLLLSLVSNAFERQRREGIRRLEVAAFRSARKELSSESMDPHLARKQLLLETFALHDGRWVSWGTATIEDHELRIAWLSSLRNGIDQTIARHSEAIALIRAAGVSCLADVEQVAA